jgi:hypothetical protein
MVMFGGLDMFQKYGCLPILCAYVSASLLLDKDGNMFGTTKWGGKTRRNGAGWGTVFEITP